MDTLTFILKATNLTELDLKSLKNRYDQLISLINKYNHEYHTLDNPTISDADYDKLFKQLIEIESISPNLKIDNSPSNRVGNKPVSYTHLTLPTKRIV